jgi:uncharacterized protein with PIN domain
MREISPNAIWDFCITLLMKCPYCKKEIVDLDEENINAKVSAYICPECEVVLGVGAAFDVV